MKYFLALIMCLLLGLYTGMIQAEIIEEVDDDETQWIRFYECADYDSFTVGISLNDDTVYAEYAYQPTDSLCIPQSFNMFTIRDERDRVLPGIHVVTYGFYVDSWLYGDRIASPDTVHMTATKSIPGGCNPISILHID